MKFRRKLKKTHFLKMFNFFQTTKIQKSRFSHGFFFENESGQTKKL